MLARQKQIIEAYVRIQAFLEAHPTSTPNAYGKSKEILDDAVRQLRALAGAEQHGKEFSVAELQLQDKLMQQLVTKHMRPIVTIARSEVDADSDPRVAKALRMPPARIGVTRLLAAATAMAETAARFEPVFVANDRPADFLVQFRAAIKELEDALGGRAGTVGKTVGAKLGLRKQLRRGRFAVGRLDALVRAAFQGNEVVLGEWAQVKRVHALPVRSAGLTLVPADHDPAPANAA